MIPPLIEALIKVNIVYEIIIVDDCSSDDSVNYLHQSFKDITVIQNEINSGFAKTANKGIFKASHSHIFLLNSDVKLTTDYFVPLLKYFDRPDTFGVMGRIIGWNDDTIQDGGKYPFFHGVKIKTSGNYIPLEPITDSWLCSMYLSGANAFIDREKILQLKGFDEIFSPFYVEDFELSLRAWRLGWKCYYEHFAVCRHKTSVTIKSAASKKDVAAIYNRNKMFLHAIHLSGYKKALWYLQLFFETFIRLITFKWYYLKALRVFIKDTRRVSLSRKMFESLLVKYNSQKSVKDVAIQITQSLAGKAIKKF